MTEQDVMGIWGDGYNDCVDWLENVIAEMSASGNFDQATLDEITRRIENE